MTSLRKTTFFNKLSKQLEEFAQDTIIIGGDFNCALTSLDKKGGNLITKRSAVIKEINALCDLYNLNDIWRNLNPEKQNFTWRTNSFKIQCRLDYFLISNELVPFANNCDIFYAPESDHSAVSIYLQPNLFNHKRGPGFWKFNTALIRDETYVTALKMNLPSFKEKYKEIQDLGLKWDLIKMEIRGFTLQYSKRKAKNPETRRNIYTKK